MSKTSFRGALIGVTGLALTVAASAGAQAQALQGTPISVATNQGLVGGSIGNGIVQSQPVVSIGSSGQPVLGVGALSGNPDHYGSSASVSVANSNRLVGIDGAGGPNSANSISVPNTTGKPVLSGLAPR